MKTEAKLPKLLTIFLPITSIIVIMLFAYSNTELYKTAFEKEQGILEGLHVLIPLIAMFFGFYVLKKHKEKLSKLIKIFILIFSLGNLYIAGEEASWGQHYVGWQTKGIFQKYNDQNETNLHNTSSWFDQKPRALIEILIILGGIVFPIIALFKKDLYKSKLAFFYPLPGLFLTALIAEIIRTFDRYYYFSKIGIWPGIRGSEIQELYFYWFILLYIIGLNLKIKKGEMYGKSK